MITFFVPTHCPRIAYNAPAASRSGGTSAPFNARTRRENRKNLSTRGNAAILRNRSLSAGVFHAIKNLSFLVLLSAKPRHTLRAGAFFAVKCSFFVAAQGQARTPALAKKYFVVVWMEFTEWTRPHRQRGWQKTECNCKKRDSPIIPTELSNDDLEFIKFSILKCKTIPWNSKFTIRVFVPFHNLSFFILVTVGIIICKRPNNPKIVFLTFYLAFAYESKYGVWTWSIMYPLPFCTT